MESSTSAWPAFFGRSTSTKPRCMSIRGSWIRSSASNSSSDTRAVSAASFARRPNSEFSDAAVCITLCTVITARSYWLAMRSDSADFPDPGGPNRTILIVAPLWLLFFWPAVTAQCTVSDAATEHVSTP